jgi:hypothetical protein
MDIQLSVPFVCAEYFFYILQANAQTADKLAPRKLLTHWRQPRSSLPKLNPKFEYNLHLQNIMSDSVRELTQVKQTKNAV